MPDLEEDDQVVYCDEIDENESYYREDFYDKADDPYLAERLYMQRELNGELDENEYQPIRYGLTKNMYTYFFWKKKQCIQLLEYKCRCTCFIPKLS